MNAELVTGKMFHDSTIHIHDGFRFILTGDKYLDEFLPLFGFESGMLIACEQCPTLLNFHGLRTAK